MSNEPYEHWTRHAADVAFTVSAPAAFANVQRRYLAEYLTGRLGDHDLPRFSLTVHLDDLECQQIVWQATHPPIAHRIETAPGVIMLETRTSSGQRCYAVAADGIEHQARAYAIRVHHRHIDLYLHHTARKPHAYPLRLMRETMLRTYEDHGGIVFHAAGADLDGHGVMICGPRTAGKTTLLACLLRAHHGALLSNDRLILHGDERLVAVPLPVPVGRGTIEAVPELFEAASALSRPQRTIRELPVTFGSLQKAEFSAREFATALGASRSPGSRLRTILVPRLSDTTEPARIRMLTQEETQRVLTESCFTPRDEFWIEPWLVPRTTPDLVLHRAAQHVIRSMVDSVSCFEIRFGVRNPLAELDKVLPALTRTAR